MSDYQTIDVTGYKELGEDLSELIGNLVADTQKVVVRELPHTLVMSGPQYDSLQTDDALRGFWNTKDRIFVTKLNVMEVVIK